MSRVSDDGYYPARARQLEGIEARNRPPLPPHMAGMIDERTGEAVGHVEVPANLLPRLEHGAGDAAPAEVEFAL